MSFRFNFLRLLPVVAALFLQGHIFAMQPNAVIAGLKTGTTALQLAPEVPGGAISISAGGANGDVVWAVSNGDWLPGNSGYKAIYKLVNNAWQKIDGGAAFGADIIPGGNISVGIDGTVWVLGGKAADGRNIYRWDGAPNWKMTNAGILKQVFVYKSDLVCGIGTDDRVYLTRDQGVNWQLLAGPSNRKFKWTTVVNNAQGYAVVWAVGQDRRLYRWPGGDWVVQGDATGDKVLEVDATTILHVNDTNGSCWLNNVMGGDGMIPGGWSQFYPAFQFGQISATPSGKIWAISKADGKVYFNSGIVTSVAIPVVPVVPRVTPAVPVAPVLIPAGGASYTSYNVEGVFEYSDNWKVSTPGSFGLMFKVKGNDFYVGFSNEKKASKFLNATYAAIIAGWNNKESRIYKDGAEKTMKGGTTISSNDFVQYWAMIDQSAKKISVGSGDVLGSNEIISWTDQSFTDGVVFYSLSGYSKGHTIEFKDIKIVKLVPEVNFTELAKFGLVDGAEIALKTNTGKYLRIEQGDLKIGEDIFPVSVLKATSDSPVPSDKNTRFKVQKRGDYVGFKNADGLNLVFGYNSAYFAKVSDQSLYASFTIEGDTPGTAATNLNNIYIRSALGSGSMYLGKGINPDERFQDAKDGRGDATAKFNIEAGAYLDMPGRFGGGVRPPDVIMFTPIPPSAPASSTTTSDLNALLGQLQGSTGSGTSVATSGSSTSGTSPATPATPSGSTAADMASLLNQLQGAGTTPSTIGTGSTPAASTPATVTPPPAATETTGTTVTPPPATTVTPPTAITTGATTQGTAAKDDKTPAIISARGGARGSARGASSVAPAKDEKVSSRSSARGSARASSRGGVAATSTADTGKAAASTVTSSVPAATTSSAATTTIVTTPPVTTETATVAPASTTTAPASTVTTSSASTPASTTRGSARGSASKVTDTTKTTKGSKDATAAQSKTPQPRRR